MRDDDLGMMQRAVLRPDGSASLLRWLARRVDGRAVLLGSSGEPVLFFPDCPSGVLHDAAEGIRRVAAGEMAAVSISGPSWWAHVATAARGRGGPSLLVTSGTPLGAGDGALVAHAAALLALRRSADERDRAVLQVREAVLHLLMSGEVGVAPAKRVADAVKPDLTTLVRVYLVEGTPAARNAVADRCETACGGRAWVIRCPVYRHHVIILSPADDNREDDDQVLDAIRAASADACIGAGDTVALRDTAEGYAQAYHALAVARHRADRFAWFTAAGDLATVLGRGSRQWARQALRALLEYTPARPQDPDSQELRATLRSWLDFRGTAWRQLKIHRGTLAERLRHIELILGRDLSRLPVQAELHLALRLLHRPDDGSASPSMGLDGLLIAPGARHWAMTALAPLEEDQVLLDTVRAWLAAGTRPEAAATALGVSARGVRRRLERAEERLGRSLTGGPSARYDVLLALRIRDSIS